MYSAYFTACKPVLPCVPPAGNGKIHLLVAPHQQAPYWLDQSHSQLRFINQESLYPDPTDISFNSNWIQFQLHQIPTISPVFLMINDDWLVMRSMKWNDFIDKRSGLMIDHHEDWVHNWKKRPEDLFSKMIFHSNKRCT